MYSIDDGKRLVDLARRSILDSFSNKQTADNELKKRFKDKLGLFVTLNKNDELRGCIGFVLPHYTVYDGIIHCARAAAFEDPRFPELARDEFDDLTIDISILSKPKPIKVDEKEEMLEKVKIGRDGLIVKQGPMSGLLLPQVFVEYDADPRKALEMTCQKAGLPSDCWKSKRCVVESFQAQVFKESTPNGEIVEEKLG